MLCLFLRSCGGRWLIWTLEGDREAIRMVLMSFVCGGRTAGLRGEWLPYHSAGGFSAVPNYLVWRTSMIAATRFPISTPRPVTLRGVSQPVEVVTIEWM